MKTNELIDRITGGQGEAGSGVLAVQLKYFDGAEGVVFVETAYLTYGNGSLILGNSLEPEVMAQKRSGNLLLQEPGNWAKTVQLLDDHLLFTYQSNGDGYAEDAACRIVPVN